MKRRHALFVSATTAAMVLAGCGGGPGEDDLVALSYDEYFNTFSFDFDPAPDREVLADRSEMVVEATLVDVVDGPVFGSSATDPAGSRFALFVFESDSTSEPIVVRLPRPNTSDVAAMREVMPLGERAVLYLTRIPEIPAAEQDLWFGIDDDVQLWAPTTPQGFILETHAEDGSHVADLPIDGGDEIGDPPAPGSDISAWLPSEGEIIPTDV